MTDQRLGLIDVILDNGTGEDFARALKDAMPEMGDLCFITRETGKSQPPVVMITFSCLTPSGEVQRAQSVTNLQMLLNSLRCLEARYGHLLE